MKVITSSGFWLINILLWKSDTQSRKEMKMIKTQILLLKKNTQKSVCKHNVAFLIFNLHDWPVMWYSPAPNLSEKEKYNW